MSKVHDPAEFLPEELNRAEPGDPEEEIVVADMSGLAPKRPILLPVFDAGRRMDAQKEQISSQKQPPADIDRDGRMAAIKGALGASLLIWLVYALAFGAFIFVLTRLFRLL